MDGGRLIYDNNGEQAVKRQYRSIRENLACTAE